uniref:Uncharacterized protein n=1 Tax=uncultured marine virus TaxID=186617 RepID=A0A0F7L456_9VIRU|nr:hypothetical protein [uncultured marine virus]
MPIRILFLCPTTTSRRANRATLASWWASWTSSMWPWKTAPLVRSCGTKHTAPVPGSREPARRSVSSSAWTELMPRM